jgi:hypothetical protein
VKIGLIGINKYAKFLNFACDLHAYAFQQFLAKNGYDSTFLDYKPVYYGKFDMRNPAPGAEKKYREAVVKKADTATLSKLAELAMGYRSVVEERERRFDKFESFANERMKFTEEQYDSDLLEVLDPGFDCYICVTDVIWQSLSRYNFDRGFMLGSKAFEGKQKIAYAASRGASKDFSEKQEEIFFQYLNDIDTITVRERDFAEYIEENSNLEAPLVVDPVLLHETKFWEDIAKEPKEEKYVALYYVMERASDTIDKAVEYAKLHDLTVVELSDRPLKHGKITDPDVKHVSRYDVGMEEWLGYLANAEAVFTNSFHGCCFSLLYGTPFFAGQRNGQKVPNFLKTFGLESQRFGPDSDVRSFSTDLDFTQAYQILEKLKSESTELILNAISDAEGRFNQGGEPDTSAHELRRQELTYPIHFNSAGQREGLTFLESETDEIEVRRLSSGSVEYIRSGKKYGNDGTTVVEAPAFELAEHSFKGWTLRFRIDNRWFWLKRDGSVAPSSAGDGVSDAEKAVLSEGSAIPHIPVNHIDVVVLVAQWEKLKEQKYGLASLFRRR